ncbi:ribosome hibernation-promoting factor, HPF/YfiA family [Streptomyces sp. NPDC056549]|uniref:ribosome hibernation-promoting factor, HPF/YfiA family n=1 Tax=Streptomyces sp. NPDC056549 TaxID=3345864 RepID=UPI00368D7900
MLITVSGRGLEVTPALRDYVAAQLSKLQHHFDNITDTAVILSVESRVQKVEGTVHVAGASVSALSEDQDIYAAVGSLADKLDRQLIRHKAKVKER